MTDSGAMERAIQSLNVQIEKLGELRNAGTRDPGFKLWRQSTLTLIQRLWEGDDTRSTRFRRVPFSPPSTRADERSTREWYERGCGEALQILKGLVEDVQLNGLPTGLKASASDLGGPSVSEEIFPTLTLPGSGQEPAEAPPSASAPPKHETAPATPAPATRSGSQGGKGGAKSRNGRRANSKVRLKDLLGFGDEAAEPNAAAAIVPPESATPEVAPVASALEPVLPEAEPAFEPAPSAPIPEPAYEAPPPAPADPAPEAPPLGETPSPPGDEEASERALQAALEAALEPIFEEDAGRAAAEFLQNSPVFRARPRAVEPREAPPGPTLTSPSAIAVAAIAAEVTALGVPEGNRAQARAALLDLAQQLDQHEFTWDALREAVHFVMQTPALGRRVLPLLIPYLDEAA